MPPPPGMGAEDFSSGTSAMRASVVKMSAAIEIAFWTALRVTLTGSMIPSRTRSNCFFVNA